MAEEGLNFDLEAPDLRTVLAGAKEFDPRLATNLRRELRESGNEIIAKQRKILAGRPARITGSVKRLRLITPKNGDKPYWAFRRTYQTGDAREGGVSHLRAKIAAGLRTRVITGARRQGVEVRTSGPRNDGVNMARVWQAKQFRHPVFGDDSRWAVQAGQAYFFEPVTDELRNNMRARIDRAITDALAAMRT